MTAISHTLVQTLRDMPAFADLDDDTLLQIVGASANLFWRSGAVVYERGTPPEALYIVLSGGVVLTREEESLPPLDLGPGDYFGTRSLLREAPHSTRAVASEDTELMVVPHSALTSLLTVYSELAAKLRAHVKRYEEAADH